MAAHRRTLSPGISWYRKLNCHLFLVLLRIFGCQNVCGFPGEFLNEFHETLIDFSSFLSSGATWPGRRVLALRLHIMCWPLLRNFSRARDKGQGLGGNEPKVYENDRHKSMRYGHTRRISCIVFSNSKAFYQIFRLSFLKMERSAMFELIEL